MLEPKHTKSNDETCPLQWLPQVLLDLIVARLRGPDRCRVGQTCSWMRDTYEACR